MEFAGFGKTEHRKNEEDNIMAKIYGSALELIGNTPLVEVKNIEKAENLEARVLVKLEYFNPAGGPYRKEHDRGCRREGTPQRGFHDH